MKIYSTSYENRKFTIYVGSNSKENWELIDNSDIFDLWLHVNDKPSCHVIIKEELTKTHTKDLINSKDPINSKDFGYPIEIIKEGSKYCKENSKYQNEKLKIVYTTIENIKKGKVIGSVITSNEKYILV